jgi:hypothetical protein
MPTSRCQMVRPKKRSTVTVEALEARWVPSSGHGSHVFITPAEPVAAEQRSEQPAIQDEKARDNGLRALVHNWINEGIYGPKLTRLIHEYREHQQEKTDRDQADRPEHAKPSDDKHDDDDDDARDDVGNDSPAVDGNASDQQPRAEQAPPESAKPLKHEDDSQQRRTERDSDTPPVVTETPQTDEAPKARPEAKRAETPAEEKTETRSDRAATEEPSATTEEPSATAEEPSATAEGSSVEAEAVSDMEAKAGAEAMPFDGPPASPDGAKSSDGPPAQTAAATPARPTANPPAAAAATALGRSLEAQVDGENRFLADSRISAPPIAAEADAVFVSFAIGATDFAPQGIDGLADLDAVLPLPDSNVLERFFAVLADWANSDVVKSALPWLAAAALGMSAGELARRQLRRALRQQPAIDPELALFGWLPETVD